MKTEISLNIQVIANCLTFDERVKSDEKKEMNETQMERNNQHEFYSLVKVYHEAYPAYKHKPTEAKKID